METSTTGGILNETQAIRDYLDRNAAATPQELVDWLRERDIQVTAEFVASILAAIKTG